MSWPDRSVECEHCDEKFYCVNCLFDLALHKTIVHGKSVNKVDPDLKEYPEEPDWFYRNDKKITRFEKHESHQRTI